MFQPTIVAAGMLHSWTIVEAQTYMGRDQGATRFTPNLPEAEQAVGYAINSYQKVTQAGQD